MNTQIDREAIRRLYNFRCGYCSVHEQETGSELEIDHFKPRSVGGTNELSNLVYSCTTCNRFKSNFWPTDHSSTNTQRLLHPKQDNLATHIREEDNGYLTPLTKVGNYHIQRLRLNRKPLVALRRARLKNIRLRQDLEAAQQEQIRVQKQIIRLENQLKDVLSQLDNLLS